MTSSIDLIPPRTLAELIGCTLLDLRNWRRLPPSHPRHLPAVTTNKRHQYDPVTICTWLQRPSQRRFLNTILAAYSPADVRAQWVQPPALAAALHVAPSSPANPREIGPGLLTPHDYPLPTTPMEIEQ